MPAKLNLVGRKFEYPDSTLEVIAFAGINPKSRSSMWLVKCGCGTEFTVKHGPSITNGHCKSCGCLQRETIRKLRHKHGAASGYKQTPEYYVWQAMLRRCTTKTHKHYADYGGRGITVCDRWLPENNGFVNFLADMGVRPDPKFTLERRKNDLGYSKENCYWAPWSHQGSNKRNSRKLTFRGRTLTASEWSRESGIPGRTIYSRMDADKSAEEILFPYSARTDLPPIANQ